MGILEELAGIRQKMEKSKKSDEQIASLVKQVAEKYHSNLVAMYENEQFEDFKKSVISVMMALSSLSDMIFYEDGGINLQEALFVAVPVCFFLETAHAFLRSENGLKIMESLSLVLGKLLNKFRSVELVEVGDVQLGLSLVSHILSAFEAYRRKSFRTICLVPEFNWFSTRVLKTYTALVSSEAHRPTEHELITFALLFENYLSLFQFEENFAAIIGRSLETMIGSIKRAFRKPKSQGSKKSEKTKSQSEGTSLPAECTSCLTIRRHPLRPKDNRKDERASASARLQKCE
jgi:hypothetical protein